MSEEEHFAFLLLPEFTHLAFSCAIEPLRIANHVTGENLYRWSLLAPDGSSQTASCGITIAVDGGLERAGGHDRLFVVAGLNVNRHASADVLAYLRWQARHGTPLGAVCSGSYVLAAAGLLNNRKCAIHWAFHDSFREAFPDVDLRDTVYVSDEALISASGGPAASDLMLHLIAGRHGPEIAGAVADQMVYGSVRNERAEQRSSFGARFAGRNKKLAKALELMESHIETPLSVGELATGTGITVRQIQRLFRQFMNRSPNQVYSEIRLQRAHHLLRYTDLSVTEVGVASGFATASHFSRKYHLFYGRPPRTERLP